MHLERIERIAMALPEATRVDIEAWDGEPTFRVRKKNFIFCSSDGRLITVKLDKEEAAAVVASDPDASECGYGLGRHGWVTVRLNARPTKDRWTEVEEWIRSSYILVAPKTLARAVLADEG